jgi:N-acetylmuramic acid 6-phosphate etherase
VIAGGDGALRKSSEGKEDIAADGGEQMALLEVDEKDTVVGIAAGGTTPFVWGALKEAKSRGAATSLICCVPIKTLMVRERAPVVKANQPLNPPPPPRLPAELDFPVELLVGPEVVTGSTRLKAGTATKLALNMISTTAMIQLGKVWGNLMVDVRATNAKLRDRALRIIASQAELDREQAAQVLEEAGGSVKLALVMARRKVDAARAAELLEQHQGRLRPILGSPR